MKNLDRALIKKMRELKQEFLEIEIPDNFWVKKIFISTQSHFSDKENDNIFNLIDYFQNNLKFPYLTDPFNKLNHIDLFDKKFIIAKQIAATYAQFLEESLDFKNNQALLFLGTDRQSFLTKKEFQTFFDLVDPKFMADLWNQMKYLPILFVITKNEDETFSVTGKIDLDDETIMDFNNPLKF